jgi:hypothetical protein
LGGGAHGDLSGLFKLATFKMAPGTYKYNTQGNGLYPRQYFTFGWQLNITIVLTRPNQDSSFRNIRGYLKKNN